MVSRWFVTGVNFLIVAAYYLLMAANVVIVGSWVDIFHKAGMHRFQSRNQESQTRRRPARPTPPYRKQSTRWSLTIPTACMKA
jgi:hypothetical protein